MPLLGLKSALERSKEVLPAPQLKVLPLDSMMLSPLEPTAGIPEMAKSSEPTIGIA